MTLTAIVHRAQDSATSDDDPVAPVGLPGIDRNVSEVVVAVVVEVGLRVERVEPIFAGFVVVDRVFLHVPVCPHLGGPVSSKFSLR